MSFPYTSPIHWYKGNTHLHTTYSDGGMAPAAVAELYAATGYDFLFSTDHFVASDVAHDRPLARLLWLDGVELDGRDEHGSLFHIVGLGRFQGIEPGMALCAAMEALRAQGGLAILAHPQWSGNTFTDTGRWRFDGVEIYNHVCQWLNGKGDGRAYWNHMLSQPGGSGTLGFAVDDAHLRPEHPGWNGGWICVNAPEVSAEAILASIRRGDFYSSCGPVFHRIALVGDDIEFECSPIQFARLVGPAYHGERLGGFDAPALTGGRLRYRPEWAYAYLEIEDGLGHRAWSTPLILPETI